MSKPCSAASTRSATGRFETKLRLSSAISSRARSTTAADAPVMLSVTHFAGSGWRTATGNSK